MGFQTDCTATGEDREARGGAIAPPITAASLFTFPSVEAFEAAARGESGRYIYTRGLNPTVQALENKLAILEQTEAAKCFASGMAAIASVIMETAQAGDHVIASLGLYPHTYKLLVEYLPRFGVSTTFVEAADLSGLEAAIRPNTRLLYLESPANPTMQIVDLAAVVELARRHDLRTAMDNSLASPYNQHPADYGVDYVIHSATKYLSGHSDVVAGAVCGTRDAIRPLLQRQHADLGGILGPFEAWLVLRGIRTLGLRMQAHNQAARTVADWLSAQPGVARVFYPGSRHHDQRVLAEKQMRGGSGMVGLVLDGGLESARRFVEALQLFSIAVSWGGFESLALPMWTGSPMPEPMRRQIGLAEGFVRLSIGLEDVEDLTTDLERGLVAVAA